jgi:DNA polymerase (family X)
MDKAAVARIFDEIAVFLELQGDNPFKVRAYQNAARTIDALEQDLQELVASGGIEKVPGLGKALLEKVVTLVETGRLKFYDDLKASIPPGLIEMLEVPGLGPKKIKVIYEQLNISTLPELITACEDGRVADLPRFGAKTAQKIIDGIRNREAYSRRHLWWEARRVADPILEGLRGLAEVERAESAGSLRRGLETVGDLDFIVGSNHPGPVMDWFTAMPEIQEVTAKGETKSSVRIVGGLQADLRVVPPEQFVFALHHFTGSKDHNVLMRQRALARGYSLSEWGIVPKEEAAEGEVEPKKTAGRVSSVQVASEEDLFRFLGLHYIPPELREGIEEIHRAEKEPLPRLLEPDDLRGVFHNHTVASDGHNTLAEMAAAAAALGWEYLGIADHSKASFQANGLDEARLEKQLVDIRRFNEQPKKPVHLFAGVECDILPDGRLDLDDETLRKLDYVVVSVHSAFAQSEEDMTRRIIRAVEHPCTTMLGHVSGRLLLMREGYKVNHQKVIDAAIANHVIIEINAHPRRLDMDWRYWQRASERGLMTSINPDAHSCDGLGCFYAGVMTARKGWLGKEHVLNTRSLAEVEEILAKKRGD